MPVLELVAPEEADPLEYGWPRLWSLMMHPDDPRMRERYLRRGIGEVRCAQFFDWLATVGEMDEETVGRVTQATAPKVVEAAQWAAMPAAEDAPLRLKRGAIAGAMLHFVLRAAASEKTQHVATIGAAAAWAAGQATGQRLAIESARSAWRQFASVVHFWSVWASLEQRLSRAPTQEEMHRVLARAMILWETGCTWRPSRAAATILDPKTSWVIAETHPAWVGREYWEPTPLDEEETVMALAIRGHNKRHGG
jgi:hypothetical protein